MSIERAVLTDKGWVVFEGPGDQTPTPVGTIIPPVPSFTAAATNLVVSFDGSGSTPGSASIASYGWQFGDEPPATYPNEVAVGDSITYGEGGGSTYWPDVAAKILKNTVTNAARLPSSAQGWTSVDAAIRVGAINPPLAAAATIPADTSPVTVTVTTTGQQQSIANQVYGGTLGGIAGTLTHVAGTSGTYTFARKTAGTATAVAAGNVFHCTDYDGTGTGIDLVVMLGRNDLNYAGWTTVIENSIDAIVARFKPRRYLVVGTLALANATDLSNVNALSASLSARYGSARFLNAQAFLASVAAMSSVNLTPTATDASQIQAGYIPDSLSATSDRPHLNASGYLALGQKIAATVQGLSWGIGGGESATGATTTHTYAAAGSYPVTETVTAQDGGKAALTKTVTVSDATPTAPEWTIGSYDDGLPSSLPIVLYTDIYATLTSTQRSDPKVLLTVMGMVGSYASSKGWGSYAALQLPAGFDYEIPGFSLGSDTYAHGLGAAGCVGLLGGLTNGTLQARLRMKPDSMTSGQLATVASLSPTSTSGYTTNPFTALYMSGSSSGKAQYLCGLVLDGADMQTVTDYRETGPACWSGVNFYHPGANSIMQNLLVRAFGHADSTSPPGETGMLGNTRGVNTIHRRIEADGRLPGTTTRRGGMFLLSGVNGGSVEDAYLHDSYTSGLSWSFAGSISAANDSTNFSSARVRVADNANHYGQSSGYRFSAVNQEEPQGTVTHTDLSVGLDKSVASLWDASHMSYSNLSMPAGNAAQIIVRNPIVTDGGAYSGDNGCFSIMEANYSKSTGLLTPEVYLADGTQLQPWVRTGAGTAPSYVTPTTHYILKRQN